MYQETHIHYKRFVLAVFLCCGLVPPFPPQAFAQNPLPERMQTEGMAAAAQGEAAGRLFAEIRFQGGEVYQKAYHKTALYQILQTPPWQQFLDPVREAFQGFLDRCYPINGATTSLGDIKRLATDQWRIGAGHFQTGAGVIAIHAIRDQETAMRFLDELVRAVRKSHDPNPAGWSTFELSNGKGWTVSAPDQTMHAGVGIRNHSMFGFIAGSILREPLARSVVLNWARANLHHSPGRADGMGLELAFFGRELATLLDAIPDDNLKKAAQALSLDDMVSTTLSVYPDGEGFRVKYQSTVARPDSDLMAFAAPGPLDPEILDFVPFDADSVSAQRIRLDDLVDRIKAFLGNLSGNPNAAMQVDAVLDMIGMMTEIDIHALLRALGQEVVLMGLRPETAGGPPWWKALGLSNLVAVWRLQDEAGFQKQLDAIVKLAARYAPMDQVGGGIKTLRHGGHAITYAKIASGTIAPSLLCKDGYLIMAANPLVITRVLDHLDHPEIHFLDDPDFRAALARVGGDIGSGFSYKRYRPQQEGLGGMTSIALASMLAGMLLPAIQKARATAQQASCKNNLKQIGIALALYTDHFGRGRYLPSSLADLAEPGILGNDLADVVQCPNHTDSATGYIYLPVNMDVADVPSGAILCFDRHPHRDGTRNVLFADGHVEAMPESMFRERLARIAKTGNILYAESSFTTIEQVLSGTTPDMNEPLPDKTTSNTMEPFVNPELMTGAFWMQEGKAFASAVDLALIPPAKSVTQHQFSMIAVTKTTSTEIDTEGYYSGLEPLELLVGGGGGRNSMARSAVVAILAAVAIRNLLQADITANEACAISSLRVLASAQATYRASTGSYATLQELASSAPMDAELADGEKCGYLYLINDVTATSWQAVAVPSRPGTTGKRYFYVDESGVIRQEKDREAGPESPQIH